LKKFKFILRLSVTLILVSYLIFKTDIKKLSDIIVEANILFLFIASLLYLFSSYLSTLRWKLFVCTDCSLAIRKLFSIYMVGTFFNIFLPGIMGGDLMRIIILRKITGIGDAVASVFLERYIGFFALLFLGFIFFLLFYSYMPKNELIFLVPLLFLIFSSLSIFIFALRKFSFFRLLIDYFYKFNSKAFSKAFLYSFIIQLIVMFSVYLIFLSIDASVRFYEVVIYLPVIIVLTTLPISISGLGVREWSFVLFFGGALGNEKAVAVAFLWFLSVAFASLLGGIEYLRFKNFFDMPKK